MKVCGAGAVAENKKLNILGSTKLGMHLFLPQPKNK
jgi:hypothetical protein